MLFATIQIFRETAGYTLINVIFCFQESEGTIRRCRVPPLLEGVSDEDDDSHTTAAQSSTGAASTSASASSANGSSGAKPAAAAQHISQRNVEVAIDCFLGDAKYEGDRPTYRLALKTDYFSLKPSQPSPFLSVRAFVFGSVHSL